ncbi:MAG: 23S rRNA (pseudouridine(1915)-N(3))-methyltransferase RlmH [Bacteroidales bacterium]|mgnify:FL=1|nr:23S rRNA (pseudouridine(1915)-N(3))-methyltransferase RlmH [Bacteroidales bacterium]
MKITLLLVGKTLKGWVKDGLDIYAGRLGHYVGFNIVEIPELKNVSAYTREQIKQKEGELILKSLKKDDNVILLDERGIQESSMDWASRLQGEMSKGRNMVYVVGGAYGFSKDVYDRADGKMSLSRMTFSHQMVRVIFAEQLYRAFTILGGEPYHHE